MDDKPRNVKTLLAEAKDMSELMVDLAYAAVYFGDEGMADAVVDLEEDMSETVAEMRALSLLAVRNRREAEEMTWVLRIVSAIERIANSAVDIGQIVTRNLGIPQVLVADLAGAAEVSHRLVVREGSHLANRPLSDMELPVVVGMRVVAIQSGRRWNTHVDGDTIVEPGDVLFMRGEPAGIVRLRELAAAPRWEPPALDDPTTLTDLDRAVDTLVEMKNLSETAVGLAYSCLVLRDKGLAREIKGLEARLDEMKSSLQTWVLRAGQENLDPSPLRGLLHLAEAAEDIGDQALEMVAVVLDDGELHGIVTLALGDTDEVVVSMPVAPHSEADTAALGSLGLNLDPGFHVLAVRRGASYLYNPRKYVVLHAGDEVLASGPEEGQGRLAARFGYRLEEDDETGVDELIPL
ncbi:MAG: potassium channel protein [Actinomycetia bacterium]|nr:potassium channel protein [Actinomycetes bacterium]MCP4959386.1 potassium channel protein [Actinomycetes bacterium]